MSIRRIKRQIWRRNASKTAIRKPSRAYIKEGSVEHLIDLILDECGATARERFSSVRSPHEGAKVLKRVVAVALELLWKSLNSDLPMQIASDNPAPHENSEMNFLCTGALALARSEFLMVAKDRASLKPTLKAVQFKDVLVKFMVAS